MDFVRVYELKKKLDEHGPLDPALAEKLREVYRVEWTYHSNAIEGKYVNLIRNENCS
ncbi:hypothetical protein B4064_2856 [Caldibacillus thermoamylovorans]|uniref:Uncharacterized protein n=1 Tax=Caldibacillus thermoamylovorans TaxID=35841 RepID=A0A090IYN2_9BACI|nr:hypothetical protein B4065_2907 [Caldibacillus thermoamylovorans]KIO64241.1 hypothetical protein B4064_2856 [Caldibacillus thermoamylovorans]CEE03201.1 hypothetical protein BT1A1_3420 [Caldibacillus thermoamylovorans]